MNLALFDFDGTLTRRDSLFPFLRATFGTRRFLAGLALLSPVLAGYAFGLVRNDDAKNRVLQHFLRGRSLATLRADGRAFASQHLPSLLRPETMAALAEHRRQGDTCVLVSASLDVYLQPWAAEHGFAWLISSRLQTTGEDTLTGELAGENCHGPVKARQVLAWLDGRRPSRVTAYGNSSGDAEMLALADTAFWVGSARPPASLRARLRRLDRPD